MLDVWYICLVCLNPCKGGWYLLNYVLSVDQWNMNMEHCCVAWRYSGFSRQYRTGFRTAHFLGIKHNSLRGGQSGDRIQVGGEIFRSRPDLPWGPPRLLYNGYQVFCPGVKRPWRDVSHPPLSSAVVKERIELYLYSHSGFSWPVIWQTSPFLPFHRRCW